MIARAATQTEATPSDEALLAEITPPMLAKLKLDSRLQSSAIAGLLMAPSILAPELSKQFDIGFGIPLRVLTFGLSVCAVVILFRALLRTPPMLRQELRYRREHGKWRWER